MQTEKKYFNSKDARTLITHYDFALIPIHGVVDNKCTCGNSACTNVGKHPATKNGLTDATKDIDQLIKLWDSRKGLNVGIATGAVSGIFVIDIDGAIGEKDIAALGFLPATLTATTGRGRHLFFKHPGKDIKTRRGVIGEKVDVRGDGGYVVGAGSNHATGAVYEWHNPLEDIVAAPQWLLDIVTKEKLSEIAAPPQINTPRLFVSNSWTEQDAVNMLSHISPDIGYDEWIKVGMALQSEGFGFHVWDSWSRGSSAKYQQSTMAGHWKSFKPGHGVSFGSLVHMAQEGGWGRKRQESPRQEKEQKEYVDQKTGEILEFKLTDWIASTRYKGEAKPIQWLVEGVLPLGVPCLLAAMGGLGKSFIALDMCIKVATPPTGIAPTQILGHDVKEHGKAVLITAEDSFDSIHRRVNKLVSPEKLQATLDNLIIIPMSELNISQLLVKEGMNGLEMTEFFANVKQQLMGLENIKLIVIDPLQAFVGADITGKPEAAQFMWSAFAKISSQSKATFLSTHHMRKDGNKDIKTASDAREGIRGTTGLVDGARLAYVMWQVTKDVGEAIALKIGKAYEPDRFIQGAVVKANDESDKNIMTFYREDNGTLTSHGTIAVKGEGKEVAMTPDRQEMYDAILDAIIDHGEMVTVYQGQAQKKCITFDQLRERLELRAYKEFTLDSDDGDTKKAARRVKNSTNNARVALKKMGKIGFHNCWIWAIAHEVESV